MFFRHDTRVFMQVDESLLCWNEVEERVAPDVMASGAVDLSKLHPITRQEFDRDVGRIVASAYRAEFDVYA